MGWDEVTKSEFAEYILYMRMAAQLNKREFSKMLGCSLATYMLYEDPEVKKMPKDPEKFMRKVRNICLPFIQKRRSRPHAT